jgi:hypothetical protein
MVEWFRKAADQAHAGAMNNLGRCYEHGLGVEEDPTEGMYWYGGIFPWSGCDWPGDGGYSHGVGVIGRVTVDIPMEWVVTVDIPIEWV